MKIERIRIEGFGALRDLDLAWPEGRVLLAVDPNETGKTTLCEAIVAALYGLPKTRGERSSPRGEGPGRRPLRVGSTSWRGNPLVSGSDLRPARSAGWSGRGSEDPWSPPGKPGRVRRDRDGGTHGGSFRATAYLSQNILDRDSLDAGLTVELARIAGSGGRGPVVRALKTSTRFPGCPSRACSRFPCPGSRRLGYLRVLSSGERTWRRARGRGAGVSRLSGP